jgi:hypothetical protein
MSQENVKNKLDRFKKLLNTMRDATIELSELGEELMETHPEEIALLTNDFMHENEHIQIGIPY